MKETLHKKLLFPQNRPFPRVAEHKPPPTCYGTQTVTSVLTTASQLPLSCAGWTQTKSTFTISFLDFVHRLKILRHLKFDNSEAGSAFIFGWDVTNLVDPSDWVILSHWVPKKHYTSLYMHLRSRHVNGLWQEKGSEKVLRPAISTQVLLGFPAPKSKCWDGSQDSKLPLHASHVALPT